VALLICQTCPRDGHDAGSFGPSLDQAVAACAGAADVSRRHVACVGGCPAPGSVALETLGKARVRFSGITADDAAHLVQAAAAYDASATGEPGQWRVPENLAGRITAISRKPSRSTTPSTRWSRPTVATASGTDSSLDTR
jgi:predicted metal-binding protein